MAAQNGEEERQRGLLHINIHETCVIRLMEVLLHGGTHVGGWTAKVIHEAVLTTFGLSDKWYRLNQLRYDLRKLKGHGLLERDGSHYAYRLTTTTTSRVFKAFRNHFYSQ